MSNSDRINEEREYNEFISACDYCSSNQVHIAAKQIIHHYTSPIGELTLVSDGEALIGLMFGGREEFSALGSKGALPIFAETCRWLDTYFGGGVPDFTPALKLNATPFRVAVYDILLTIPYGQTMTYGEIANILAKQRGIQRMSAQAVGGAVGHNPIPIIVPCHRVIGADGSLTGYAGGLDKKTELLKLEKISLTGCAAK